MIPVVGRVQGGKSQKRQIKKTSGLGGGEQLGGDQGGQGVFLGAEALEQKGLFVRAEAVPYVDHLQGSVEYGGVWGVGHGGYPGLFRQCGKRSKLRFPHGLVRRQSWLSLSTGLASLASGCLSLACCGVGCSVSCSLGKGRLGISCIVVAPRKVCFFQSQVIPRSQKALAGYSTANDKKNFMSADVGTFIL